MKFAVVGLGFIFPRHKSSINQIGAKIVLTCDSDPSKHANFTDWREMFDSRQFQSVDAVVICTPNYLHAPLIHAAVERGKKVLCEKPLAISVRNVEEIAKLPKVFAVMQLRYHPIMQQLRELPRPKIVSLYVSVKRDEDYWKGWKGDDQQSGGILYNLAVHYFDALMEFLGPQYRLITAHYTPRTAVGVIDFAGTLVHYFIEITDDGVGQGRWISIDGKKFMFSDKDNLSYEDLHREVYEEFRQGVGVTALDVLPVTKLINEIKWYGR